MIPILALTLTFKKLFPPEPGELDVIKHIIRLREKLEWKTPVFPRSLRYQPKSALQKFSLKVRSYPMQFQLLEIKF